ncbi:MAG: MurR/RpiR family transcriptional regulator [Rhodobacteraceae bacterium]|nr:MurR/RpiR family transcriptional regulator [Paracoccaceae bacterium]
MSNASTPDASTAEAAPASVDAFRLRLAEMAEDLPRRMRQCADYIAANTDRIAVSTVAELAAGADVPPSALMRFCQIMGFSGFSDMQRLFREAYSPGWPDYSTRLRNLKSGPSGSPAALLAEFVEAGRMSLEALAKSVDDAALGQAVALLSGAGTLHLVVHGTQALALWGARVATLNIVMLFLGQRLAKDYAGAASLVPYFVLCAGAMLVLGMTAA